jgi:SPP1 family predicted phage head-tail adaptor
MVLMSGIIGKMDRRITVQVRTMTKDSTGGRVETWADSFDCWAEVIVQKQTESEISESDRNADSRQFRIRYKSGLASGTHRILYQLRFYNIKSITEEGRQDRLVIDSVAIQSIQ